METQRILTLGEGAPHPKAIVQSIDAKAGALIFAFANETGVAVDSGNSLARFTPVEIEGDPVTYGDPTDEVLIDAILNPAERVLTVQEIWDNFLAGYIPVPHGEGFIELKANRQARNDFIGQATLLREAIDAGLLTNESVTSIWDRSNVEHTLTVAECRTLLVRYGILWHNSFNELAP